MSREIVAAAVMVLLATEAPTRARAQDGEASAPELFRQGVTAYEEQRFEAALDAFQRSYARRADPGLLYNIALTEAHVARYAEAYRDFRRYLAEAATIDEPRRAGVQAALADLATRVALVTIEVEPAHATVSIDGTTLEAAQRAETIALAPGAHVVDATADRYAPGRSASTFTPGERRTIRIALEPSPATLILTVEPPRALVHIDGVAVPGGRVRSVTPLRPGRRRVRVSLETWHPEQREIDLEPGSTTAFAISLRPLIGPPVLSLTSSPPGAFVRVGSRRIVQTPWTGEVSAGNVAIRFEAEGRHPVVVRRRLVGGRRYRVVATLVRDLGWLESPWFWIAGGTVVTGGIAAGVLAATREPDTRFEPPTTRLAP